MKSLRYFASFTVVALILSAFAFAKDTKSGSFDLAEAAQIGSTTLQPGHYKAEWTGSDNALSISIVEHGKTVATAQGTMKQLPSKATSDAVIVKTGNDNSSNQIQEIDFNNRTEALVLSGM